MENKHSKHKKELGRWGEEAVDRWMEDKKWRPISKNLKIKKGEIDRIYTHQAETCDCLHVCLMEIKTSIIFCESSLKSLYTETGVKRFLKQRQINNLYRYGENLMAQFQQKNIEDFKIYLRFILVFKMDFRPSQKLLAVLENSHGIKKCHNEEGLLIFSVEPEFTTSNQRKSLLQIKI